MQDYLRVCEEAVRRAGAVILDRFGRVAVRRKGPSDLVTEADLASQEVVRQTLYEAFPGHLLVGEEDRPESIARHAEAEFRWIVDPLDGTTNYVHQVPFFCVSLALEHRGELIVASTYDPVSGECFSAAAGQGAYLNGSRIRTSGVTALGEALVTAGFPNVVTRDAMDLRLFNEVVLLSQSVRRTGSAALNLAYIAAGRFDAGWSCCTQLWDVAAGTLLIREAGGTVTSLRGDPMGTPDGPIVAAATPKLHAEVLALVHRLGISGDRLTA
jgi:myo-inositol-1(or 4)-monophosphatase